MKSIASIACILLPFLNYAQTGKVGIGTTNPQAQLHATGAVRFDTLAGAGRRIVYADANGNITAAYPKYKNETVSTIPDNNCTGLVSSIVVTGQPDAVSSANIKVKINVIHTSAAEVAVYLVAPTGQQLLLSYAESGDGYRNTIFWDGASQYVLQGTSPFTGTFRPLGGLGGGPSACAINSIAAFGNINGGTIVPNGEWKLKVIDSRATATGQLLNWSVSFDGSEPGIDRLELPSVIPAEGINTPLTGSANMLAVAYGVVYSTATNTIVSSTNNSTLAHPSAGTYVITFTGTNLSGSNLGTLPVLVSLYGGSPGLISFYGDEGKITVTTFNSSGQPTDRGFTFLVYKP